MGLDGIGWDWMGLDGIGWDWMGLDGIGWDWMRLDGIGWDKIKTSIRFISLAYTVPHNWCVLHKRDW